MSEKIVPIDTKVALPRRGKRRLSAILLADAVDYSTSMHQQEMATFDLVRARLDLMTERLSTYGGELVNHTGDGFLALFESVTGAVQYATDMIKKLEALQADDQEVSLPFRFGVHVGEVIFDRDRVFGDAVNLTSRLQALADPGTICTSRAVYDQIRMKIDCEFTPLGKKELKGISDSVELFIVRPSSGGATARGSIRKHLKTAKFWERLMEKPAVAVMPLDNLSSDEEQEFFTDGLTEDVITNLSRFRGLSVIARTSVFVLKGKKLPLEEIAQRLGVRYIVEGSVRRAGKRIRVSVMLNDVREQKEIWSERYDRDLEDIFEIQNELTEVAVAAMAVHIESAEQDRLRAIAPHNFAAYGLILQGQHLLFKYTRDDNHRARRFYEQGIEKQESYARGLAALSRTHNLDWRYGWTKSPDESLEEAHKLAVDAIRADQRDARGHAELGYVRLYRKEHESSIDSYRRAQTLNPSDANILMEFADTLSHSGYAEDAVEMFEKAMRLNPYYPDDYLWGLAGAQFKLGQYEAAIRNIQNMNNPAQGQRVLVASLALNGQMEEARYHADLVRETQPGFDVKKWYAIVPDISTEAKDRFVEGLKMAGL